MNILIIDNYDSFVYNLYHLIGSVAPESAIEVARNDRITVREASFFDRIVISPGPGVPSQAGRIMEIIGELYSTVPILGVCLGHQAIAQTFGAGLCKIEQPLHGIQDRVNITSHRGLFRNLPPTISAGRYHSWAVSAQNLPQSLEITAVDSSGCIMALSHTRYNLHGVQFHPESILTPLGTQIIHNFIHINVISNE